MVPKIDLYSHIQVGSTSNGIDHVVGSTFVIFGRRTMNERVVGATTKTTGRSHHWCLSGFERQSRLPRCTAGRWGKRLTSFSCRSTNYCPFKKLCGSEDCAVRVTFINVTDKRLFILTNDLLLSSFMRPILSGSNRHFQALKNQTNKQDNRKLYFRLSLPNRLSEKTGEKKSIS